MNHTIQPNPLAIRVNESVAASLDATGYYVTPSMVNRRLAILTILPKPKPKPAPKPAEGGQS